MIGDDVSGAIVIPAVYFDSAKEIVAKYGSALDGRICVDITNPVDVSTFAGLSVPEGSSAAEELQKATGARVVKAFNTTFAGTLTNCRSTSGTPR